MTSVPGVARRIRKRDAPPRTVLEFIHLAARQLRIAKVAFAHGTTDPVAEAAFLVGETLGVAPQWIERSLGSPVTPGQGRKILALIERRIRTRKPAAYLVGRVYMRGVPFAIDERAIVPRSFLGEVIDGDLFDDRGSPLLSDPTAIRSVLDLCTGSGCLAILAALRFPRASVDAVEISEDALALARTNVAAHNLNRRVRLLHGDLFEPVQTARYDLIIANPPYVDAAGMKSLPPECRHEPRLALAGGADGLAVIRRILDHAGEHLTDRGGLLCEVGRGRERLERAYPNKSFLWLDTEDSSGEVFWLDASQLR
jgi:ribosomal protein L3 glutamine methyltransferase